MGSDAWRPWRKGNPESLAHYVNAAATRAALPKDTFALNDLRSQRKLTDITRSLYETFAAANISYDLEPISLDDPGDYFQRIRTPKEIVGGQGTCIDLAVTFAAACIQARLLPCVLLLRNRTRAEFHALVCVDTRNTYDEWQEPRGWLQEDSERGWLEAIAGAKLWGEPDGVLWKRIRDGKYLLVECTGFAATPTLSFAEAQEKALRHLREMAHIATLDIVRLQKGKSYSIYDPERAAADVVYQIIQSHYPALADFSYDAMIRDLVERETRRFTGRSWVTDEFARFRATSNSGYFCIVAEAGLGKTALAAEIVRQEDAPAFFFSASENRIHLDSCLKHLAVDVISRFALSHDHLPERSGRDWSFLNAVLREAAARSSGIVLVIDGIDEAQLDSGTFPLSPQLPKGVHVVLSSRVDPVPRVSGDTRVHHFRLSAEDPRQAHDIGLFLEREADTPDVDAKLSRAGVSRDEFVTRLQTASAGNFMYLTYVLDELLEKNPSPEFLRFDQLPRGLRGYYTSFWEAMHELADTEGWNDWNSLYRPTIAMLAAAAEPVSALWLGKMIGRSAEEITERALKRWKRFLRSHSGRWAIVHKSFADFLVAGDGVDGVDGSLIDIEAAHATIARHYLNGWGGIESHLPALPNIGATDWVAAYGLEHLAEHLHYSGDPLTLRSLITEPRWYSLRSARDPSGDAFHFDAQQALAAAQEQTRREIENGQLGTSISAEIDAALTLATINSLSNNLPGDLPAALVQCGHWSPDIALRAIRLNPDATERGEALAALAPLLDEPHITAALAQARSLGSVENKALAQLLRRLCVLDQAERAMAEAAKLSTQASIDLIGELADVWPARLWPQVITRVRESERELKKLGHISAVDDPVLARVFLHAPSSLLPSAPELARSSEQYPGKAIAAVTMRWAQLGQLDEFEEYLAGVPLELLTITIAQSLKWFPKDDPRREKYITATIEQVAEADPWADATSVSSLAAELDQTRLRELIESQFQRSAEHWDRSEVFRTLGPFLTSDMLDYALAQTHDLDDEDCTDALIPLALRAAELGQLDDAIQFAKRARDSYQSGLVLIKVLPRLAQLGHAELAVKYAEQPEPLGRDIFVPGMLVAVSKHVTGDFLDRLRERAKHIQIGEWRRQAMLGIAARYAATNNPAEALILASLVDDSEAAGQLQAKIAVAFAADANDADHALAVTRKLTRPWNWQSLNVIAKNLRSDQLNSALQLLWSTETSAQSATEYLVRAQALTTLLRIGVKTGHTLEALESAHPKLENERFTALIAVAECLDAPSRARRLRQAMNELLAELPKRYDLYSIELRELIAVLDIDTLREFETSIINCGTEHHTYDKVAQRYAELGQTQEAIRIAMLSQGSSAWTLIAPSMNLETVREVLATDQVDGWHGSKVVTPLFARLAALGSTDEILKRIKAFGQESLKHAAIAGAASTAPHELLLELMRMLFGRPFTRMASANKQIQQDATITEPPIVMPVGTPTDAATLSIVARRYGELGRPFQAIALLRLTASSLEGTSQALAAIAPKLTGSLLDEAIEIATKLTSSNWPQHEAHALAALLPILAQHDARRAIRIASSVQVSEARMAALNSVVSAVARRPAIERYHLWNEALQHAIARPRAEMFADLAMLVPLVAQLGGAPALTQLSTSLDKIIERWP